MERHDRFLIGFPRVRQRPSATLPGPIHHAGAVPPLSRRTAIVAREQAMPRCMATPIQKIPG